MSPSILALLFFPPYGIISTEGLKGGEWGRVSGDRGLEGVLQEDRKGEARFVSPRMGG